MSAAISATGSIVLVNNVADSAVEVSVNGVSFAYYITPEEPNPDDAAALQLYYQIRDSTDPLILGVIEVDLDSTTINITAVTPGAAGNSITLSSLTPETVNLSGETLSGGADATSLLAPAFDNSEEVLLFVLTRS